MEWYSNSWKQKKTGNQDKASLQSFHQKNERLSEVKQTKRIYHHPTGPTLEFYTRRNAEYNHIKQTQKFITQ